MTRDANARLNLFQDGRVADVDYLPGEALDQVLQQRWPLHRYNDGSVWMLQVNHRPETRDGATSTSPALQLANDPGELVYKVLKTPSYTAGRIVVSGLASRARTGCFAQEYPPPRVHDGSRRPRAEYLELAKQELGVERIPRARAALPTTRRPPSRSPSTCRSICRRTLGL